MYMCGWLEPSFHGTGFGDFRLNFLVTYPTWVRLFEIVKKTANFENNKIQPGEFRRKYIIPVFGL